MPLVEYLKFVKNRFSEFVVESGEFSRKILKNRKLISDIYLKVTFHSINQTGCMFSKEVCRYARHFLMQCSTSYINCMFSIIFIFLKPLISSKRIFSNREIIFLKVFVPWFIINGQLKPNYFKKMSTPLSFWTCIIALSK